MRTAIQALADTIGALAKFEFDICDALAHSGTHSFDDIVRGVLSGSYDVFFNDTGIAVCELSEHPLSRAYHVFVAAGEKSALIELQPEVSARATSLGCTALTLTGRAGWSRALVGHGWVTKAVHMTYDLT